MPGVNHIGGCNCCDQCLDTAVCVTVKDCLDFTPLPDRLVELIDPDDGSIVDSGTTDADGEICFTGIEPDPKTYDVKAYIGDHHTATKSFRATCDTTQEVGFNQRSCETCVENWPTTLTLNGPFGKVTLNKVDSTLWTGSETVEATGIYECFESSGAPKINQACADYDTATGVVTIQYRFSCAACGPTLTRDVLACGHCQDVFGEPSGSLVTGQLILDRGDLNCGTEPTCPDIPNNWYAFPGLDRDQDGIPASDIDCFDCFDIELTLNFNLIDNTLGDEPVFITNPDCEPTNEKQQISTSGGSSGFSHVTLNLNGVSGNEMTYGDTAAQVKAALEASSEIDEVNVTGGPLGEADLVVEFVGSQAETNVNEMDITNVDPDWTVTITTLQDGEP